MNKPDIDVIDRLAARLMMVSFFIPSKLQMFVVAAVCMYFVARSVAAKHKILRTNLLWALLLGSGLLLFLLAVPLTEHEYVKVALHLLERRESFLLMPVAFAIIAPVYNRLMAGELIYFVYACFISCVVGNADFAYHYFMGHAGTHPLSHVLYRDRFEDITGLHPTYMSMYLVFSICILFHSALFNGRGSWLVKNVLLYFMLFFLLSMLAKSPLIALVIILLHAGYVHRKTLYRYKAMIFGASAAVVATGAFVPFFRQRISELLPFLHKGATGVVANNSVYVRKLIWRIDTDIIRQHWLTGVGPGRMLQVLHERYFFYSVANNFPIGYYDPHNEYFSEWICFGIMGVLLFVAVLAVHVWAAIRSRNTLYQYLLIILCITFFTETILSRQQGVLFYSVFTSLFFFSKPTSALPDGKPEI